MRTNITKIFAAVIALFSLSSCNLNLKPESSITYNGFWDTEEGARSAFTGNYARFRDYGSTFWVLGEVRSDLYGGKTMETPFDETLMDNDFNELNAPFGSNFANFYGLMHNLNDFIANAPHSPLASNAEDFNNMMAQMYGIRAYVYYTMLKTWGDVVISTSPADGDFIANVQAQKKKRAPKSEVMAQVLTDLNSSLDYYKKCSSQTWRNSPKYWSKNATLTLMGDALLWKGEVLKGGAADFRAAKDALSQVTGSLVAYEKLWGLDNEGNSEFIFVLDYQEDQAQHWFSSFTAKAADVETLVDLSGQPAKRFGFQGANRYGVSQYTISKLYEEATDKRQGSFILFFDAGATPNVHNLTDEGYKGAALTKFMGITDKNGVRRSYENFPLYRYADVLLLLAEAKNQLGEDPSTEINKIRQRAGVTTVFTKSSKLENKKIILDERLKEFAGEGKRWWDLVRAGDDLVFAYVTKLKKENRHMIYLPISKSLISKDPEYITQTEGYK